MSNTAPQAETIAKVQFVPSDYNELIGGARQLTCTFGTINKFYTVKLSASMVGDASSVWYQGEDIKLARFAWKKAAEGLKKLGYKSFIK